MQTSLKKLADIYYGKSPNEVIVDDSDIPIFGTGGVYGRASRALVHGPALVVPRKGSLGNPQLVLEPFWASDTTYFVLPKSEVDIKWLYYNLYAYDLRKLNEATGVPSINRDWLYRITFDDLSFGEQGRIAEILLAVDETIKQTEALIAKYQRIKTGLMYDLFTRGVTSNGRLRPVSTQAPQFYKKTSIGLIPKDWNVGSIDHLLARIIDYRGKTPEKVNDGVPLITAKNVRMGFVDPEPREFIAENDYCSWMTRGIPTPTDVLFTTEAPLGNVSQVGTSERVAFAQRVIILQPASHVRPIFLKHLLMSDYPQRLFIRSASGTTALGIKQSEFRKILVSYPIDKNEQLLIEERLETMNEYIETEHKALKKLNQQKNGLMQDLLTGKVRVHE